MVQRKVWREVLMAYFQIFKKNLVAEFDLLTQPMF